MVEGKDYKLNIRPQSADDDFTYPDSVINATNGKIFYVDVVAMGGYTFDNVAGGNTFAWGIDKFDFAAANVTSSGDTVTVKNGNMTVDPSDYTVTKDETAGTVTVAAKEGSKNYTGSQTVKMNNVQIQAPVISSVKVVGNKATVILSGESNGASGYDYVISKANDYSTERVDVTKNQIKTNLSYLNRKNRNGFSQEDIHKVANSRLGWYRRSGMNVVNFIISKDLLENRIKDGAGLLNPLSYYLAKVGI